MLLTVASRKVCDAIGSSPNAGFALWLIGIQYIL